jgi:hypothetical protein
MQHGMHCRRPLTDADRNEKEILMVDSGVSALTRVPKTWSIGPHKRASIQDFVSSLADISVLIRCR